MTFILPPPVLVLQQAGFRAITFPLSASGNQLRASSQFSGIEKTAELQKCAQPTILLLHLCNRAIRDYLQLRTRRRRTMRTQSLYTHCRQCFCDLISVEELDRDKNTILFRFHAPLKPEPTQIRALRRYTSGTAWWVGMSSQAHAVV